jgi:hypothetical protein
MLALAWWIQWPVAIAIFLVVAGFGWSFLRGLNATQPEEHVGAEDVQDLDVFFVCKECGTEFQVTRLGEVQVPRHCGEPMMVVRRPKPSPLNN